MAQDNLSLILACHEEALAPIYASRIQKRLRFKETVVRYSSIDNPKEGTFSWILDDTYNLVTAEHPSPGHDTHDIIGRPRFFDQQEQIRRAHMRDKFITWLGSSEGIFHFTGIPGAGKSTMMKFIYENPATKEELHKWAGSRTLCLAKHFFWRPGSDLQHNLTGLLYSLLHGIFKSCPELIPDAMPKYWEMVQQIPIVADPDIEIPPIAVENALFSLIQDQNVIKDHCFCFFIDGLDEFLGSDQQDYTSLANLLTRWVDNSNGSLKICVSSREENAFMNAFPQDQRLQLHQLTWDDISTYVREGLQGLEDGDSKDGLIYKICDRAKGVFIWVILVVRDIREKIESGETNPEVIEANLSIPDGLENLIAHTLHRLGSGKRKKLSQVVAMLRLQRQFKDERDLHGGLSLTRLAFSFLDEYNSDHGFATKTTFNEDKTRLDERLLRAEKQLRYCSGGFLKISEPEDEIVFIHRSIPEVLDKEEFRRLLGYVDTDEAAMTLSHLTFAQVRAGAYDNRVAGGFLASVMTMCLEALDESIYDFLAHIHTWYNDKFPLEAPEAHRLFVSLLGPNSVRPHHGLGYVPPPPRSRPDDDSPVVCFNALFYAAIKRNIKFARFIAERNPDYLKQPWIRAQVVEILLLGFEATPNLSAWNSLLDGELLGEHENRRFTITDLPFSSDENHQLSVCNISIWQWFLTYLFLQYRADYWVRRRFITVEWFLSHGASTNFEVKIYSKDISDEKTKICISFGNKHLTFQFPAEIMSRWAARNPNLFKLQTISLRDWITHFAPDNLEKLLVLINTSPESDNHHSGDVHSPNALARNRSVLAVSKEQKPAIEPEDARSGENIFWISSEEARQRILTSEPQSY
uniref:Nephrocystin 3-like N-terminal domain-containing protein n=1 Tax=Bionectria ochroleuca TaxID=29856 RepID=A0A8H7N9S1_BIOOC